MWVTQSPLLQLPYFDSPIVDLLKQKAKVEDIADFMNMDDDLRQRLLNFTQTQMSEVATVCSRYPNLELQFELDKESYEDDDIAELEVII